MRTLLLSVYLLLVANFAGAAELPNIGIILTYDQGDADISLNPHHRAEVSTPHMDALARDGVVFSQRYLSEDVYSPTRAGLMLGQYQQRVGVYSARDGGRGFDPQRPIFPSVLPDEYVSTAFDAWLEPMAAPITGGAERGTAVADDRSPNVKQQNQKKEIRKSEPSEKKTNSTDTRPNVLFIVCDDLNTHVSTSGYDAIRTPAFDELAAAGMTFQRAYCQYPVCGPSRASFLSGIYPESTGILDNKTDIRQTRPGTRSMPQAFREAGYWTGSVGKVFHNPVIDPGEVAWNEVLRFENDEMPHVTAARKQFEAEHGSVEKGKTRRLWQEHLQTLSTQTRGQQQPGYGPSGLRDEQHKDGKNVRQIASWLDSKAYGDKPFFIACGIQKPHVPFLAPDAYFAMYSKPDLQFTLTPPDFWKQAPRSAMVKRFEAFGFELGVENDDLRREYTQAYHACISFIDAQIGQLFKTLKRNELWDNTIVVLTSDHGYQLGEHFMWGKVTLFEVCDRVPLVIRVPGMTEAGSSSNGLVELIDIFPTLAELCSVEAPDDVQGRSIVPILRDASAPGKSTAYTVVTRGQQLGKAIRTDRWRYARWPDGEELYDLRDDPLEHLNLASFQMHRETITRMRNELNRIEQLASSVRHRRSDR